MFLDPVHNLIVGDGPITVFLEPFLHRVESLEEFRSIWRDDSRGEQLRKFFEELGRKLMILLVRLEIGLIAISYVQYQA